MGVDKVDLDNRMKRYEWACASQLTERMPVVIRVDGRAFHTLLAQAARPFSTEVQLAMDAAMLALCEEAQGAEMAYAQSDEISVLLNSYRTIKSQPWFANEAQKIASISASVATAAFNHHWLEEDGRSAHFDARVFVLPEAEVANYFIWRQRDWERNSLHMLARSLYSTSELVGKKKADMLAMCREKGVVWEDLHPALKRGRCAKRQSYEGPGGSLRYEWRVDDHVPVFSQARDYVEQHLESLPARPE